MYLNVRYRGLDTPTPGDKPTLDTPRHICPIVCNAVSNTIGESPSLTQGLNYALKYDNPSYPVVYRVKMRSQYVTVLRDNFILLLYSFIFIFDFKSYFFNYLYIYLFIYFTGFFYPALPPQSSIHN